MKINTAVVCGISALAAAFLVGCPRQESAPKSSEQDVVVAINPAPLSSPLYVAQEQGFFKQEGLNVTFKPFPTGKQCLDALLGGAADMATVAELPVVRALSAGKAPVIVVTFEASDRHIKVVSKRDVKSAADLAGLRVGVPVGTSAEYFLYRLLSKAGLPPTSIRIVNLRPPDMPVAFKGGQVDAVCIWEPAAINSEKAVPGSHRNSLLGVYTETFNMVVRRGDLTTKSDCYRKFVTALQKAKQYMDAHAEESQAVAARATNVDSGLLKAFWGDLNFRFDLPEVLGRTMKQQADWLKRQDPTAPVVAASQIGDAIDASLLPKSPQR